MFVNNMKEVKAIMKVDATFQKHILHDDDIEWIKKHGCTVETVYRTVKKGEEVICEVYSTQNFFLAAPYYSTITSDGYNCCLITNCVDLKK